MAEHPPFITDPNVPVNTFVPDCLYDKYLPKTPYFEDKCFRAGGDEFMVISCCDRFAFEGKIDKLRSMASNPDNVCFSVGCFYNDSDADIRDAMRIADEEMYKDKDRYYSDHPERKYR